MTQVAFRPTTPSLYSIFYMIVSYDTNYASYSIHQETVHYNTVHQDTCQTRIQCKPHHTKIGAFMSSNTTSVRIDCFLRHTGHVPIPDPLPPPPLAPLALAVSAETIHSWQNRWPHRVAVRSVGRSRQMTHFMCDNLESVFSSVGGAGCVDCIDCVACVDCAACVDCVCIDCVIGGGSSVSECESISIISGGLLSLRLAVCLAVCVCVCARVSVCASVCVFSSKLMCSVPTSTLAERRDGPWERKASRLSLLERVWRE